MQWAHFQKKHAKSWSESEEWRQSNVGYMKIQYGGSRIHENTINIMSDTSLKSPEEATCRNRAQIEKVFWSPAWKGWRGQEGKWADSRAIRQKIITNRGSMEAVLRSKNWYFSVKKCFVSIFRIVLPTQAGIRFSEKRIKKCGRKVKNWARRSWVAGVRGICGGLVAPKSENSQKVLV